MLLEDLETLVFRPPAALVAARALGVAAARGEDPRGILFGPRCAPRRWC
jgi:hypothetical protein